MYRKIIAVFMAAMVVATTCVVPSFATDYQSKYNFWNWAYDNSWFLGKLITGSADNVCSVSEDTLHHSTNHQKGEVVDGNQQYTCICDDCGQTFSAVATDLESSYNDGLDGISYVDSNGYSAANGQWRFIEYNSILGTYGLSVDSDTTLRVQVRASQSNAQPTFQLGYLFSVPVDCKVLFVGAFKYKQVGSDTYAEAFSKFSPASNPVDTLGAGTFIDDTRTFNATANVKYYYSTAKIWCPSGANGTVEFMIPRVYIALDDPASAYERIPVNIGGSVQYTDDNSNNKIYDAEFMDFSTNEYHNPVTDYSTKVDNWNYDYSTRTFTGCTEDGDVKIVYGDEYMSVTENGNIYNYYYSSDSGSGSGGDSSGDDDGDGLFGKIGELLGTLLGGLIDLVTGVLSGILDSLISLVEMTIEKLGSVVNLFGSFGDALRALWSWLPEDIITILSAGVSVVIFAAVLKLFI